MGSVMMAFVYILVMSFADIDSCYTLNKELENQKLCVEGVQSVIDLTNYGVMFYAGTVVLGIAYLIRKHKKEKESESEKRNGIFEQEKDNGT